MNQLEGIGVALITPFKGDNSIDIEALYKLVNYQIENGINYLVVLGTTGEPATLTKREKKLVIETVITANNGRLPLVLGIGGNNTLAVIEEINQTDLSAFTAILSVSPYYNKPTQQGIYAHFSAISEASPLPIIIYNVPGRTASNIAVETTVKLANNCKNIIAIKEAAGDMVQAMRLIQRKPKGFLVISGDDMIALPMVLAGGNGVISVIGQGVPKAFSELIQFGLKEKSAEAYQKQYQLMDAIDMVFEEGNPAGIKALLAANNICKPHVRLPLVAASDDLQARLGDFLKR